VDDYIITVFIPFSNNLYLKQIMQNMLFARASLFGFSHVIVKFCIYHLQGGGAALILDSARECSLHVGNAKHYQNGDETLFSLCLVFLAT
jgi:hypothetical protein